MKTCCWCHEEKPYTDFYKRTRAKDGYSGRCKVCDRKIAKGDRRPRNLPVDWSFLEDETAMKAIDWVTHHVRKNFKPYEYDLDDVRNECMIWMSKHTRLLGKDVPSILGRRMYSNAVRLKLIATSNRIESEVNYDRLYHGEVEVK